MWPARFESERTHLRLGVQIASTTVFAVVDQPVRTDALCAQFNRLRVKASERDF
jgi:hypothetical protein